MPHTTLFRYPVVILLDLPGVLSENRTFDGVRVLFDRLKHDSVFLSVELLSVPLSDFLPKDASAPEAVGMESEYRTSITLSNDAPLEVETLASPEGILKFGMARPEAVRREKEHLWITVRVLDVEQDPPVQIAMEDFVLPRSKAARTWADAELPLHLAAAGRVKVQFSLHSKRPGKSLVVLSSPRIERRGAGFRTVVLVTSDTHRADHLGSSSRSVGVQTPFLDRLASQGVMFENAFSSTNITNPSHAALMTALSPRDTRMVNNNTVLSEQAVRSEEHTSELQSRRNLVCRLLLEKKKNKSRPTAEQHTNSISLQQ